MFETHHRQEKVETAAANSRFAKAGVWCFYDSEVQNSSFVHLIKFSGENPRLRKAAKRSRQAKKQKKPIRKLVLNFEKIIINNCKY
jgi:hypothetical protein